MKSIAFAAIAMLAFALPAQAQRNGTYNVDGTDMAGAKYQGTVQLQSTGRETWRVTWRIGGETTNGVGVLSNGVLAVGYTHARDIGAVAYIVNADGTLSGRFTQGREGGVGTERWMPR